MRLNFSKMNHFFNKMRDIIITDICYLMPCAVKWFYHRKIKRDIFVDRLESSSGKKANLYHHGHWESEDREAPVTLILHGRYSHPFVMIHLVDIAKETYGGSVFSFYVTYDENFEFHRSLLKQAIDAIEKKFKDEGTPLKGIVVVGHSMGAIEGSYSAFVENDKRIISVISIAGRLKVVESILSPCRESLKETLHKICKGVQLKPELPLYQIVAGRDWNAPMESTLIRKVDGFYHIVDEAMHFNILFHQDIYKKLPEYLHKSLAYRTK